MSEVTNINPGEVFKLNREKQGLSINDVSIATKINPRILKALEEGQKEGLPPQSFTRGFIRSYAAYLKIDSKPILEAYFTEPVAPAPLAEPQTELSKPIAQDASQDKSANTNEAETPSESQEKLKVKSTPTSASVLPRAMVVTGLIFAIGLVIGVKKLVDKYDRERVIAPAALQETKPITVIETTSPVDSTVTEATSTTESATTPTETTAVSPESPAPAPVDATSKNANSTSNSEAAQTATSPSGNPPISTPATGSASQTTANAPATASSTAVTKTAEGNAAKSADIKTIDAPKEETKPTKPEVAKPIANNPQEIILEALDSVEISVAIDGEAAKKIQLKPEAVHTIKAKSTVSIDIKDGGMVNIIHNGKDKGVPGDLGKPTKIKFP